MKYLQPRAILSKIIRYNHYGTLSVLLGALCPYDKTDVPRHKNVILVQILCYVCDLIDFLVLLGFY